MKVKKENIRNFCIIAHIDHGKSTLADRILEYTHSIAKRDMKNQLLDQLDLERERGITIKLNAIQIKYFDKNNEEYLFHLIDTPGHVDFTYEVSRSLAACDGALLIVDATQGVQPQTIANAYLAIENDVLIISIINKIDLPAANVEQTKQQIESILGIDCSNIPLISAKTGLNIDQVFDAIVNQIPSPSYIDSTKPLKGLIFDSYFDEYRGAILLVAIKEGTVKENDRIVLMSNNHEYSIIELGIRTPFEVKHSSLEAGEVGWIAASIKSIKDVKIGDTITLKNNPAKNSLPGYRNIKPMVFCGFYPIDTTDYQKLKDALDKLLLEDSALEYEKETSQALGFGFRLGFLGLLHLDIIKTRIEREYKIDLITTAPSVKYHVYLNNKTYLVIDNPSKMPKREEINYIEEPFIKTTIIAPTEFIGNVMTLCFDRRASLENSSLIDDRTQALIFNMPLNEIVFDFFNQLKSITKGYASFDYEFADYKKSDLVKVSFLLNGEEVDALSLIIERKKAYYKGKEICLKLKDIIPKQNFEIPIQASIGAKIIARETIKALRKNVLSKCYGGDITRKKKLLEKQKKGKKRMKQFGSVELPQEAFFTILNIDENKK